MKGAVKILSLFLLLSMSPPPEIRIIKEYSSIGELTKEMLELNVLNYPKAEVGAGEKGTHIVNLVFKEPYTDVVVHDDVYGDIVLCDDILRYIAHLSMYYHLDMFYILSMIQHDNKNEINLCTSSEESEARLAIWKRTKWAYRIRALGVKEEHIFLKYRELPKEFFN